MPLWNDVMELLRPHAEMKRETPEATLNRLFKEYVPDGPSLREDSVMIRRETWDLKTIGAVTRRHVRIKPCREGEELALVVVEYQAARHMIDGNNRSNLMLKRSDPKTHAVLVVEPKTD